MDTTTKLPAPESTRTRAATTPARWAWCGVAAGALGLAGNFVSSHGNLSHLDAATAIAETDRAAQHIGTLIGMAAFVVLVLLASGWRRWAASGGGVVEQALAPAITVTATLVLLGTGLRGGMAEYLPGGINADNFDDNGLYVLFMLHDTAPWFAWWGVVAAAGLSAYLSFITRVVPLWLGILSTLTVLLPVAVMAMTGAVAGAGLIGPLWLTIASLVVAVRGLPSPTGR